MVMDTSTSGKRQCSTKPGEVTPKPKPVPDMYAKRVWQWRRVILKGMLYLHNSCGFGNASQVLKFLAEQRTLQGVATKPGESGAAIMREQRELQKQAAAEVLERAKKEQAAAKAKAKAAAVAVKEAKHQMKREKLIKAEKSQTSGYASSASSSTAQLFEMGTPPGSVKAEG